MRKPTEAIADLFRVPKRFLRSVQLERDFNDPQALEGYIVTPAMSEAFQRIAQGLRPGSGQRAWRITGDYGVGKSSFALVLAHLLRHPRVAAVQPLAEAAGWPGDAEAPRPFWPILVTGAQENLVAAVAHGVDEALGWVSAKTKRGVISELRARAQATARARDGRSLEDLIAGVRAAADGEGAGVLLIVDEMGKLLEHAASQAVPEDVFALQRLAEIAARSGEKPFLFVGLLHQAFQAYSGRLPTSVKLEWDKVAGRFEEIVFDQPLVHTAALVAGALGVRTEALPKATQTAARAASEATSRMGWLSGGTAGAVVLDAAPLYPIHPTLLPPLVRFFARFGQHERSLFGFLLSEEPGGLQAFARRPLARGDWYGLPEFYDYIRAAYGHRLAGDSYQNHWLRITAVVAQAEDVSTIELRALKAIAVLNLLDAEDLQPTDRAIGACLTPASGKDVGAAIRTLVDRGLLHQRGAQGGYRLWPSTSVNLHKALTAAARALEGLEAVSPHLLPYLKQDPLLARRHYIERGTLRYFEVRYALADAIASAIEKPTVADGLVVVALCDTLAERTSALEAATRSPIAQREDVIVGVGQPLGGLRAELVDLKRWTWVQENTPELAHDAYAADEVSRQIAAAQRSLNQKLSERSGLRAADEAVVWLRQGAEQDFRAGLTAGLSAVCNELYPSAPRVFNELLNRNSLSSAAAAARMRLIERLFTAADQASLGIDESKAPPERSMYLSVLKAGNLHVRAGQGWRVTLPAPGDDPLNLSPVFDAITRMIAAGRGARVPVTDILAHLKRTPFGVRDGLAPLLLAVALRARGHEYALYEDGTFLHRFGPTDFLRLTKGPAAFEIQHCQVEGVRAEVFEHLAAAFASQVKGRRADILDVVTALCQFAAALPEYTRKAGALSPTAAAVRDALLTAQEPATLLFKGLPLACGFGAFDPDEPADPKQAAAFVETLQAAIEALRHAYQGLVGRIVEAVAQALGAEPRRFDRGAIANRAARVSLAARELRLRGLALQLRDPALSDEAWAENLGSYVLSRPPKKWGSGDEARFREEIAALGEIFCKVEAAAFSDGEGQPATEAMRLNLTRGDGADEVLVVHPTKLDVADREQLERLRDRLPQGGALRVQFLTQLLWEELTRKAKPAHEESPRDEKQWKRP